MTYIIILDRGVVIRNSDRKIVAPCQSADDPDFVEYINWIEAGNQPTVYDTDTDNILSTVINPL